MVWASGTRSGQRKSSGIGLSSRGTFGVGIGRSNSKSQSNLAAACAPPKRNYLPKLVILILVVMFWIPLFSVVVGAFSAPTFFKGLVAFVIATPLLGSLTYGLLKLYQKMDWKNKQMLSDYGNTWVCMKCGATFL